MNKQEILDKWANGEKVMWYQVAKFPIEGGSFAEDFRRHGLGDLLWKDGEIRRDLIKFKKDDK